MTTDAPRPLHLFLTVGGSPAPLRSALVALRPDRVTFVVSDGSDGTTSSRDQVESARLTDRDGRDIGPGLRFSEGCPAAPEIVQTPPDDPDRGFALLRPALLAASADARLVADYTGGTKSMSTALFIAAVSVEGVGVQFMRGQRSDLRQVADGTEAPFEPPVRMIGVARRLDLAADFARRRDYGPAQVICKALCEEIGPRTGALPPDLAEWGRRAKIGRDWFAMLDAWDRFAFRDAHASLEQLARPDALGPSSPDLAPLRVRLAALREAGGEPSFALVEDLWLNALRRADLGRWDDAVARLYRCCEAALQAHLWADRRLKTKGFPIDRLPDTLVKRVRADGSATCDLGLIDAGRVLRHLGGRGADAGACVVHADDRPVNLSWQSKRNDSILAHGFQPLGENHWTEARDWFEARKAVLWEAGLGRKTAPQLPGAFPA